VSSHLDAEESQRWTRAFRWDLDKTYLRTEFDGFVNLARTLFQRAHQKQSIPGAPALMRELRASGRNLISIISGSPRQMRRVLEEKLRMDGIQWDEFILKPSLSSLLRGRFSALRDQIGYKLPVLLAGRTKIGGHCPEVLFGDDSEADAFIYSLYADLLADRLSSHYLKQILDACTLYPDQRLRILDLAEDTPRGDLVERIFIYLEEGSPPSRFSPYGRRVIPITDYLQAALVLMEDGVLTPQAIPRVVNEMLEGGEGGPNSLRASVEDLSSRGFLSGAMLDRVHAAVATSAFSQLASLFERATTPARSSSDPVAAGGSAPVDYLSLLADTRRQPPAARN
jgi:hypothetical protein